jgi:HEAT repeat protein/tetratricopeptide (TPR) repeat protein
VTRGEGKARRVTCASLLAFALCSLTPESFAQPPSAFLEARKLEHEDRSREALLLYLTVPGAEYAAARVARANTQEYLPLIAGVVDDAEHVRERPSALLVQADLLVAAGDEQGALKCYRRVAEAVATEPGTGWKQGMLPHDYYPVEPPRPERVREEALPFTLGPGSHRDNWLIRRFIGLEAWDEAAREFARIWQIHRRQAGDGQFLGLGLEFAIDYSYFLKRQGQLDEALGTLLEPLVRVDMDRNPGLPARGALRPSILSRRPVGVSRKEFVRIAWGAFETAGRGEELVDALQKEIDRGTNRARRVLARVRLHQGRLDDALALEVDYIESGDFDGLSAAYRRGLVYEGYGKPDQAVVEYEQALALPYALPNTPDVDEETVRRQMASAAVWVAPGARPPASREAFRLRVIERLLALCAGMGRTHEVLRLALQRYECDNSLLRDLGSLEQTARRFRVAGEEERFAEWARGQLEAASHPVALADLRWTLGDWTGTAKALADAARESDFRRHALEEWKQRFRRAGEDQLHVLLEALVEADPTHALARLELLDLEDRLGGEEAIEALGALLDADEPPGFENVEGECCRTRFRNYCDLAYRLMRLYEETGQFDELRALGLRVARGDEPFGQWWQTDWSQHQYRDANGLPEDINACLALAIEHADTATLDGLSEALGALPDHPATAQLARRRAGGWEPHARDAIGWANLPEGVSALACNENVLSLACDNRHVYAGMPWGVAVYRHDGEPVTRVALETAALDLRHRNGRLWVGTPLGLASVAVGSWEVSHIPLDRDVPPEEYDPEYRPLWDRVCGLALDGPFVWVGTARNIQRLDTRTNTLRVYSQQELGVNQPAGWGRFIVEADHVWADGSAGCLRYDRRADAWAPVVYGQAPVRLVALADGRLWGYVRLNDELRDRPCLIDRATLEIRPALVDETEHEANRQMNGPFAYFGTWRDMPVLGPKRPAYVYDARSGKLRPLPGSDEGDPPDLESDLPAGLRSGEPWRRTDGGIVCRDDLTHRHEVLGRLPFWTGSWAMARLPDGTAVLAGRRERCPRYGDPAGDWTGAYETWDEEGGLYLLSPGRPARRVSSVVAADSLPGDEVLSVVLSEARNRWACTNRGLAALAQRGGVSAHFTRADGLCANRVVSGSPLGGRVYFAAGWNDHGGGLVVYDPRTTVFTSLSQSDGLATDKLASIEPANDGLKLVYDIEPMRDGHYRLHPPGTYDPRSARVRPGGEPLLMRRSEGQEAEWARWPHGAPMPYLGGSILSEKEHEGRRYLCGTRGLVIAPAGRELPPLRVVEPQVQLVAPTAARLAEASQVEVPVPPPLGALEALLEHENPYVRARALAAARDPVCAGQADYVALVGESAGDPDIIVRTAAVSLLARAGHPAALGPLARALDDVSFSVRAVATLGLLRQGRVPPLAHLEEAFRRLGQAGPLDCTAPLSVARGGRKVAQDLAPLRQYLDRDTLHAAVAPQADREVFTLLMEHPVTVDDYEPRQRILAELGNSLRKHPEAAEVLLAARQAAPDRWAQVRFAWSVFGHAGKPLLPILHEALESPDRVVRSNAARACGAVGDAASVPHLVQALDLESGLSRASIVWALGELQTRDALPQLVRLYVEARNDEDRAGFRAAQSAAEIGGQYDAITGLDSIAEDWDELARSLKAAPVAPARNEDLLEPGHILEALRKIGPAVSQEFYRTLAAQDDAEARREAAVHLAEAAPQDAPGNVLVLTNLLADADARVRMRAAVSLLLLGQDRARQPVVEWLDSPNEWERSRTLEQLLRVHDPAQLTFVRTRVEALAADPAVHEDTSRLAQRVLARLTTR